ncbi:hypothetical protein ER308_00975 [Egibacter rhizosphaerae]|uniref:BPL/LPL catalytic domain-containing protein n=1 Tax=Egibacter rhizosphaerae TaxID=1670831 RepID=A0A411YAS8_9ACTN|nr:hypothetical protein [Egibacter rhizosphaerae]QBI18282.1 hypothetical protein ER308_00975 [Egibacter rhizosphaerae]
MSRSWVIDPLEVGEPTSLLARSEALLDRLADDPVPRLRWYRASRTAIVRGRGQRHLTLRRTVGIEEVTRGSGGGAVLLDPGMLSLDVLLPADDEWLGPRGTHELSGVFLTVGEAWRTALADLGVPDLTVHPDAAPPPGTDPRAQLLAAVCYAVPGRGEVLVGGRKLVGLAQRRRRHGALVQCGLLRRWCPERLLAALGADPSDPEIHDAAVGLDDVLDPPPDDTTIVRTVERAFTDRVDG